MMHIAADNPFHAGEREAQRRAGAGDIAAMAGGFIRDYLPEQHRDFYRSLPFLIVSGADPSGQTWVTLIEGEDGFVGSPDTRTLTLDGAMDRNDPLAATFGNGADVGLVGIELRTRRRNRLSGHISRSEAGYVIAVRQTFGNCPQYIHQRAWTRVAKAKAGAARSGSTLSASQKNWIEGADTLFIGSGHQKGEAIASRGFDASHRGGAPGFVQVDGVSRLRIPDYPGNNFFNTIGNLVTDPRIGLLFIDFETGGLLHVSGRATINWQPDDAAQPHALRMIDVDIETVIERPGALRLRWARQDHLKRSLKLVRRVKETTDVTSFYFAADDGRALDPFVPGQHLPIEVNVPGQDGPVERSYSLSGAPDALMGYRLSIKRDARGLVSRHFHDELGEGSVIRATRPAGEFVLPKTRDPLVLISAGVGVTPMMAMLHGLQGDNSRRTVWFVHGARNGRQHALGEEARSLINRRENTHLRVFYSSPEQNDVRGEDYHQKARIAAADVLGLEAGPMADYMLCGPAQFVSGIRQGLQDAGVPDDRIHVETFGPGS